MKQIRPWFTIFGIFLLIEFVFFRTFATSNPTTDQAHEKLINAGLQSFVILGSMVAFYISTDFVQRIIAISTILFAICIVLIDRMLQTDQPTSTLPVLWWVLCACQDVLIILFFVWPRLSKVTLEQRQ